MVADPDFFKATTCPPPVIASLAQASICSCDKNTDKGRPLIRASDVIGAISSPCEPRVIAETSAGVTPAAIARAFLNRAESSVPAHPKTRSRGNSVARSISSVISSMVGHHNHYRIGGFGTNGCACLTDHTRIHVNQICAAHSRGTRTSRRYNHHICICNEVKAPPP